MAGNLRRSGQGLIWLSRHQAVLSSSNQGSIDLSNVQTLILDEADRMLDMGFVGDIERVIARCHDKRQTLLFSATYNKEIKNLASKYLDHPVEVAVARENTVLSPLSRPCTSISIGKGFLRN